MKSDLVIVGAGGHGRELLEIAEAINDDAAAWNFLGFLDDNQELQGSVVEGHPVLGGREWLNGRNLSVAIGVGSPAVRRRIALDLAARGDIIFPSLVHPRSTLSRRCELDIGTQVFAGVVIATRTRLGKHVLVGRNGSVGHDIEIGDFVNLFPAACLSGQSRIGEGCEIGTNATVIPGVGIGAWSVVGAGSVVTRDLPGNITAVGMPAREIKRRESGWHLA